MAAYYKISYGTGFAWLQSYVIKVDYPTTDYGALTDILIDYLVAHDRRKSSTWIMSTSGTETIL